MEDEGLHEEPPSPRGLGDEESTEPIDEGFSVSVGYLDRLVRHFCSTEATSFLERGQPYVSRIYQDYRLGCPHVIIKLRAPFKDPSKATVKGVREELEALSNRCLPYFEGGVAISAYLD